MKKNIFSLIFFSFLTISSNPPDDRDYVSLHAVSLASLRDENSDFDQRCSFLLDHEENENESLIVQIQPEQAG